MFRLHTDALGDEPAVAGYDVKLGFLFWILWR